MKKNEGLSLVGFGLVVCQVILKEKTLNRTVQLNPCFFFLMQHLKIIAAQEDLDIIQKGKSPRTLSVEIMNRILHLRMEKLVTGFGVG